jgi:hypothetical protein
VTLFANETLRLESGVNLTSWQVGVGGGGLVVRVVGVDQTVRDEFHGQRANVIFGDHWNYVTGRTKKLNLNFRFF